ncbi:MAG: rhodanese-like domain-containing protein [Pseudomonadota bacterium]
MIKAGAQTIAELVAAAERRIETVPAVDVIGWENKSDTVFVDVRDIRERQREGMIPGSFHCPRGMLEFWLDPASPYAKSIFAADVRFIFHCAKDWRSLLATERATDMGLRPAASLVGGFEAWRAAGGAVEQLTPRQPGG